MPARNSNVRRLFISLFFAVLLFTACRDEQKPVVTPWGTVLDSVEVSDDFDLDEIEQSGELLAVTLSGPETYYDYHGFHLGLHTLLCQRLAAHLGVRLRMEVCRDTAEMLSRLANEEADIVAFPVDKPSKASPGWRLAKEKPQLAEAFRSWYKPTLLADVKREERQFFSRPRVKRHIYAPMLNRQGGIISRYDGIFQQHARSIGWDWKLIAAQCYQESTFDPHARSWAGAQGLMQIMPSTAAELGLPKGELYNPERNIEAAVRYIGRLDNSFSDIRRGSERQKFVLAAYNGGTLHIRDAMALARRDGHDATLWSQVAPYVLKLRQPRYYNDPIVKNGYMRGDETTDYVERIMRRWQLYRGVRSPIQTSGQPQKALNKRHREKFE